MKMKALFFFLITLAVLLSTNVGVANSEEEMALIRLFADFGQRGIYRDLAILKECTPVFGPMSQDISSLKISTGDCVIAYENPDCSGKDLRFSGGAVKNVPFVLQADLSALQFNDKIRAFRLC